MSAIYFRVYGMPGAQGSKRHVGHGIMVENSKLVKPWRQDVVAAALPEVQQHGAFATGPVRVAITFYVPRPKSCPKKRLYPDCRPDVDKFIRATLDALTTSGIIHDDGQIVSLFALKEFADGPTGALIRVSAMNDWDESYTIPTQLPRKL